MGGFEVNFFVNNSVNHNGLSLGSHTFNDHYEDTDVAGCGSGDQFRSIDIETTITLVAGSTTKGCCIDGACSLMEPSDCTDAGGTVLDTCDCDPNPCGACCNSDGSCRSTTEGDCDGATETWLGSGTSCDDCPTSGACCLNPFTCIEVDEATCTGVFGGTYLGDGTTCTPLPC